ncbi:PDZ domain-containing protein [Nocardiopsis mwathae]|uniref:PDZ domain-containing protein n=1 Tax=Nocardiopsis mwathae TaxID=1472723 RepID=A0A7W9YJI7_9ACTN|nr:PDZ domain-containing protein [Nocardiopsis mwathae]MBB6173242.1 PDZ domain-containing protein [Nocardiopsis mwathae]
MLRRVITLFAAFALLVGFGVAGMYLPVPYLVASPGITLNTIGEDPDGGPIIRIDGEDHYEHDGGLSMVTVQYSGGPSTRMDLFTVLSAWLSPSQAVLPEEALFPPDRTVEEISEAQSVQMNDSQTNATAAALTQLGIDYDTRALVAGVGEDLPAAGAIKEGDIITSVDGDPVDSKEEVVEKVGDRTPGDDVEVGVDRDGTEETVTLTTVEGDDGTPIIGVLVSNDMDFPMDVEISVGDVGGPSAGLMFSLGIMDRLSQESLTGGHRIAGTGTITPDGEVGAVSGVEQKMVSAAREGAEYFFVAAGACPQTFDSAATGEIEVVKVGELGDAVDALDAIRTGDGLDALPRCEPN